LNLKRNNDIAKFGRQNSERRLKIKGSNQNVTCSVLASGRSFAALFSPERGAAWRGSLKGGWRPASCPVAQAAWVTNFSFALAHAAGVNSFTWVILAARRTNLNQTG
jgi:hypothetical protein